MTAHANESGTLQQASQMLQYSGGSDRFRVELAPNYSEDLGASLKGAYEVGILSGVELNGYLADAEADSGSVETGKLYGVQLLTEVDLTSTTHVEIGGGYEWLEWDDTSEDDGRWTFSAEAAQQLADVISLTGHAKLGASENVYGGGLAFDLSNGGMNTNTLGVNYSYIDGKNGIEDDQRVELSWTYGFGSGPSSTMAVGELTDKSGTIRAAADVATISPANNLLGDVMKRPSYLPERVIARATSSGAAESCGVGVAWTLFNNFNFGRDYLYYGGALPADFELVSLTIGGVPFALNRTQNLYDGVLLDTGAAADGTQAIVIRYTTGRACYESTILPS
jgi:hypothetical protein